MFEDEITIFNKKYDSKLKDDVYIRTYLSGVNVDLKKAVNIIKSGLQNADSGTIIIPEEVDTQDKEYKKPIQFQKLSVKALTVGQVVQLTVSEIHNIKVKLLTGENQFWTLQSGDIVVLGLVKYDINEEKTIANLRQNYDDVYEITTVDTKLKGGLPHWEVGVK